MRKNAVNEPLSPEIASKRWFHIGPPWTDHPGVIYAGSEDPHAGVFVVDCGDDDEEGVRVGSEIAEHIVAVHNASLGAMPIDEERLARAITTADAVAAQHPEPWRAPVLAVHRGRALMIAAEYERLGPEMGR